MEENNGRTASALRRERRKRSEARHVHWLVTLQQASLAHHTAAAGSGAIPQLASIVKELLLRISALERRLDTARPPTGVPTKEAKEETGETSGQRHSPEEAKEASTADSAAGATQRPDGAAASGDALELEKKPAVKAAALPEKDTERKTVHLASEGVADLSSDAIMEAAEASDVHMLPSALMGEWQSIARETRLKVSATEAEVFQKLSIEVANGAADGTALVTWAMSAEQSNNLATDELCGPIAVWAARQAMLTGRMNSWRVINDG